MFDPKGRHPVQNPDPSMPGTMLVPLTGGLFALIDEGDAPAVSERKWLPQTASGGQVYAVGSGHYLHRFLWVVAWRLPGTPEIDHINGDSLDNRRSNLRAATRTQNARNRRPQRGSETGLKGVSRAGKKWLAKLQIGAQVIYLGVHDTPEKAHEAYAAEARQRFGEFARFK